MASNKEMETITSYIPKIIKTKLQDEADEKYKYQDRNLSLHIRDILTERVLEKNPELADELKKEDNDANG